LLRAGAATTSVLGAPPLVHVRLKAAIHKSINAPHALPGARSSWVWIAARADLNRGSFSEDESGVPPAYGVRQHAERRGRKERPRRTPWRGQVDGDPMPRSWESRAKSSLRGEAASIVWNNHSYLDRHRKYLRYASARRRGLPIGSGVTEGACKSVITMRFKRSGQRWFEEGLSPCLQLRALHLNHRLRPCFDVLVASRNGSLAAA
jgi:hypothetical protein